MRLVDQDHHITIEELRALAADHFGDLVKAVVDIARDIMVPGMEYHADGEAFLLDQGSKQADLWGINLYPVQRHPDWIEYDSMINLRPSQGNRSRGVDDAVVRAKIVEIVGRLVA